MIKVTKQDLLLMVLKFGVSSIVCVWEGGGVTPVFMLIYMYMYVSVQASSG